MKEGVCVPQVTFKMRAGDELQPDTDGCPIGGVWVDKTTKDLFGEKRVVVFSLPGAYTPTCSTQQLPGFEENYEEFESLGIDSIYCVSVNDAFVMNAWGDILGAHRVELIPDGNGQFTRQMGMLVDKENLGFGPRSWRYAMVVNDGVIEAFFEEPGRSDNFDDDPYGESSPGNVLSWLQNHSVV
jgi:thioredoxin-dependent peroxiredoxin